MSLTEQETLQRVAAWFEESLRNGRRRAAEFGYTEQYLLGYEHATGWIKGWAERGSAPEITGKAPL